MSVFNIMYDVGDDSSRNGIQSVLESFGENACHIQMSSWLVSTSLSSGQLLALLEPLLASGDRLWVSQLVTGCDLCWRGIIARDGKNIIAWLNARGFTTRANAA